MRKAEQVYTEEITTHNLPYLIRSADICQVASSLCWIFQSQTVLHIIQFSERCMLLRQPPVLNTRPKSLQWVFLFFVELSHLSWHSYTNWLLPDSGVAAQSANLFTAQQMNYRCFVQTKHEPKWTELKHNVGERQKRALYIIPEFVFLLTILLFFSVFLFSVCFVLASCCHNLQQSRPFSKTTWFIQWQGRLLVYKSTRIQW